MLLIGLMSGTSVDGIDAALVEIQGEPPHFRWHLHAFLCCPWPAAWRLALLDACRPDTPVQQIVALHALAGEGFAEAAQRVVAGTPYTLADVDAIASHGQTVWHQAAPFAVAGTVQTGTLQIGEPAILAARTGCCVVSDFRAADMALGGQGAPLVPFADFALFSSPQETRAVQNIGGIANVTYLPKGGALHDVIAFDTGPGNMLMDALIAHYTGGAQTCDTNGAFAAQGEICTELLEDTLRTPYFHLPPPRSTGRELFGRDFALSFRRHAERLHLSPHDTAATATALTAESIARAYRDYLVPHGAIDTVIAGGGGVHNAMLMRMLASRLAPARLATHTEFGLPDDAKEAVAFALLAHETLHGRPANVPAATGASGPAILGRVSYPPPRS